MADEKRLVAGKTADGALGQAAKRITASDAIALVLPEMPAMDVIGSAAALVSGLRALGKTVSVFGPSPLAAGIRAPWQAIGDDDEPLRELVISFDLARSPIKELKYERGTERLDIILSPSRSRLRREDAEFRWGPLRYDLVITLGLANPEAAAASVSRVPELLMERTILNIDANPANTGYGELNFLGAAGARETVPGLAYRLLTALGAPPAEPGTVEALLAALVAATNHFHPDRTNAESLRIAAALVEQGGNLGTAGCTLLPRAELTETQLAARAAVRSRADAASGTLWSLLTREDFAKTGTGPSAVPAVLARLRETFPHQSRLVLLWQHPEERNVQALAAIAGEGEGEEDIAGFRPEGDFIASQESFPSFAAAEEHIAQLLRDADAVE